MKRSQLNNPEKDPKDQLNFTSLVLRTVFLDGSIYKSIKDYPNSLLFALILVCVVSVAYAVGLNKEPLNIFSGAPDIPEFIFYLFRINAIIWSWIIWSVIASISTKWAFKGQGSIIDMLRAIGIAYAPGILFFGVPIDAPAISGTLGEGLLLFAKLWVFVTAAQAVKETAGFKGIYGYIPGLLTGLIAWFLLFSFMS